MGHNSQWVTRVTGRCTLTRDPLPFPFQVMSYFVPICRLFSFQYDSFKFDCLNRFDARYIITALQNTENSMFTDTVQALSILLQVYNKKNC